MAKSRAYAGAPYSLEKILGVALFLSLGLHILASWVFFFVIPAYQSARRAMEENVITVQLMGSTASPAPAAPDMKVNPDRKGPDVVEIPATPPAAVPEPVPDEPLVSVADPADVIPLAEKPETPPVIKKTEEKPPEVKPPAKQAETKPAPVKKPPSLDAQIDRKLKELERMTAAENPDDIINQKIANLAISRGQGRGEGSDQYGGATSGERLDPEETRYYNQIRDIISKNWVPPAGVLSANLEARYIIRIEPDGRVSASRLQTSSGNSDYDLSVERAVRKSSPFPPLTPVFGGKAVTPALRFNPNDLRRGSY